jgi:hypothetical protein
MAPCFTVHGRLNPWNGTPIFRIWLVGTNRLLEMAEARMSRSPDRMGSIRKSNL